MSASSETWPDRSHLPIGTLQHVGKIDRTIEGSDPVEWPREVSAPDGAPNVLLVMTDDVGFGASEVFGGPIPTPTYQRIADRGLRYNRFHTTALCSPSRAALLTGRNHHVASTGIIMEFSTPFPGYHSIVSQSVGTIGEILTANGYGTAWFGKNHNVPDWLTTPAGPFTLWPTGLGFEYFYGFLGADAHQFRPAVYENTRPVDPYFGREDSYHLDADLADHAIDWIRSQKAVPRTSRSSPTTHPGPRTSRTTHPANGSSGSVDSSTTAGTSSASARSNGRRRSRSSRRTPSSTPHRSTTAAGTT